MIEKGKRQNHPSDQQSPVQTRQELWLLLWHRLLLCFSSDPYLPYPSHKRTRFLLQSFCILQSLPWHAFPLDNHLVGALISFKSWLKFLSKEACVDHCLNVKQLSTPSPFIFLQHMEHYLIIIYVLLIYPVFSLPSLPRLSVLWEQGFLSFFTATTPIHRTTLDT